jgi:hypothetical protein
MKRVRSQESHQRQLVEASDSAYNRQLRPLVNPADGSRGIFHVQPSLFSLNKVGLERSTHCRGWDSLLARQLVCRLDVNHPPTAIGGILAEASMTGLNHQCGSWSELFVLCCSS